MPSEHAEAVPAEPGASTQNVLAIFDVFAVPWGLKQLGFAMMACQALGLSPPAEFFTLNAGMARELLALMGAGNNSLW
jgi:hypothetical protein